MSSYFVPSSNAEPVAPWSTALLAQRDVSQQIPINFVTNPAISLATACFGEGRYEDDAAKICVSNLLAVGFRRLLVDVFWDASRHVWSLCPVQVPSSSSEVTPSSTAQVSSASSAHISSVQLSNPSKAARADAPSTASSFTALLEARQISPTPASSGTFGVSFSAVSDSRSTISTIPSRLATSTSAVAPSASVISSPSGPLYQLGPYTCTSSIQLPLLASIMSEFLDGSDTTLSAFMQYLQINVHAAASVEHPTEPAQAVEDSDLPGSGNLLSDIVAGSLSTILYTPSNLFSERENLNASWYSALEDHLPDSNYFKSEEGPGGISTSSDGWPCEAYVEMERYHRLFISFGSIDSQMSGYNSDGDSATIFAPGYMQHDQTTTFSSAGQITSGCFFDQNRNTIVSTNNSWAFSDIAIPSEHSAANFSISNLTSCGISPLLNRPFLNTTADNDTSISSYTSYALSTIWSWAPNEPVNSSIFSSYYASLSNQPSPAQFRCAAFNALSSPPGRWHVADCTGRHYAACRSNTNPYSWSISSYRGGYTEVNDNCPSDSTFAVPRTAMENSYLLSTLRATRPDILVGTSSGDPDGDSNDDPSSGVVWINFNSLGTANCWVAGVNQTCPYVAVDGADRRRQVIVPTVAAVIVLFLGVLTMFVKCAANRQSSKRRRKRKGEGGWDYEGVPS